MVPLGIVPLPDALADILLVVLNGKVIQFGFRLEIAHTEADTAMLETIAQHGDKPVLSDGVFKRLVELAHWVDGTHTFKAFPCHRLGAFYKVGQRHDVQIHAAALFTAQSRIRGLRPAPFLRDQKVLDVFLESLLGFVHLSDAVIVCLGAILESLVLVHSHTTFLFPVTVS